MDKYMFCIIAIIIAFVLLAVNRFCYGLIFRLECAPRFKNDLGLLVAMLLKYTAPTLVAIFVEFNEKSIIYDMPGTYTVFRLILVISLMVDVVLYLFNYKEETLIPIKIAGREFAFPCKFIYHLVVWVLWGFFAATVYRIYKDRNDNDRHMNY